MILTCPQCSSRYLLPAHVLSPGGRRVKCSSCGEVWFHKPDEEETKAFPREEFQDIPDGVKPVPEGSSVPAIREPVKHDPKTGIMTACAAAACVFVLVGFVLIAARNTVYAAWPPSAFLYQAMGRDIRPAAEALAFEQITVLVVPSESGETVKISGVIHNKSADAVAIPLIEAKLRDETGKDIDTFMIKSPQDTAEGWQNFPFHAERVVPVTSARDLNLRFVMGG